MESQQTSQEFLSDEEDVIGIELEPELEPELEGELEDISTNMRFSRQSGHIIMIRWLMAIITKIKFPSRVNFGLLQI